MKYRQLKREKAYLLPEAVYRQALWAAKDLPRLKENLMYLKEDSYDVGGIDLETPVGKGSGVSDVTSARALRIVALTARISAVEAAFDTVPERYRDGLRDKLFNDVPYSESYHINTWNKWQQVLIYYIARNLDLI